MSEYMVADGQEDHSNRISKAMQMFQESAGYSKMAYSDVNRTKDARGMTDFNILSKYNSTAGKSRELFSRALAAFKGSPNLYSQLYNDLVSETSTKGGDLVSDGMKYEIMREMNLAARKMGYYN